MAGDLRDTKSFKAKASQLRALLEDRGVELFGHQIDTVLLHRALTVAAHLRISEKWALERYIDDEFLDGYADTLARQVAELEMVAAQTPPITLDLRQSTSILAGLGICVRIAAPALANGDPQAIGHLHQAGGSVTTLSLTLGQAQNAVITIGGKDLMIVRQTFTFTLDRLGHQWACDCVDRHDTGQPCRVGESLRDGLSTLGSGYSEEGSAVARQPFDPHEAARMMIDEFIEAMDRHPKPDACTGAAEAVTDE